MKCPRCKINELNKTEVRNALSRRDNKTHICSQCGTEEGMFDYANSITKGDKKLLNAKKERLWLDCGVE